MNLLLLRLLHFMFNHYTESNAVERILLFINHSENDRNLGILKGRRRDLPASLNNVNRAQSFWLFAVKA